MRLRVERLDECDAKLRNCDGGKATHGAMRPSRVRDGRVTLEKTFSRRFRREVVRTSNFSALDVTGTLVEVGVRVESWSAQLVHSEQRPTKESAS